ncbi:MAG TPA: hypothetical protein VMR06_15450 [Dokdonella sp.]|uniref:hypothetical protein n=1 Tax=Dokdonella sp. TaxID=2291710 RepID=UPI002BE3055B|nr:hypothetical protein [Dokdonella sp.]HUD43388.1 hypothetical protein [Dokdonella sp.]
MPSSSRPYYRQRGFHLLCLAWTGLAVLTALLPAGAPDAARLAVAAAAAAPRP